MTKRFDYTRVYVMEQLGSFLIVEDENSQQEYLRLLLQRLDLTADIASSKKEAVHMLMTKLKNSDPYKLIFLDIVLPDGTGHEILQQLRTDPSFSAYAKSKVVMLTALDQLKDIAGAFAEACDAYLTKPIQKEQLLSILKIFKIIVE